MTTLSEDRLMAYHDGELSAEEARAVEAALAEDPKARERLRVLAETDAVVGRAFAAPLRQPVSEGLLRAIEDTPAPGAPIPFGRARRRTAARPVALRWALPLAASVVLLIGIAGGYGLSRMMPGGAVEVAETGASAFAADLDRRVEGALETAASGQLVSWLPADGQGETHVRPVLTFVDGEGRPCREYEFWGRGPDGERAMVGVACRGEGGRWRIEVAAAAKGQPTEAFLPASASSSAALDAAVDKLMVEGPFSLEQERELIDGGWRAR